MLFLADNITQAVEYATQSTKYLPRCQHPRQYLPRRRSSSGKWIREHGSSHLALINVQYADWYADYHLQGVESSHPQSCLVSNLSAFRLRLGLVLILSRGLVGMARTRDIYNLSSALAKHDIFFLRAIFTLI